MHKRMGIFRELAAFIREPRPDDAAFFQDGEQRDLIRLGHLIYVLSAVVVLWAIYAVYEWAASAGI